MILKRKSKFGPRFREVKYTNQTLNGRVDILKGIINKRTKSGLKLKDKFDRYKTKTLI